MPFFPPGSSGGSVPWENLAVQYCSPSGSNVNDGTGWTTPKLDIYHAIQAVNLAGGGTVYVAEGCHAGGPVSGQGIRLRSDYMPNDDFFFDSAPGFLKIQGPLRIVGVGGQLNGSPVFNTMPMVGIHGGGDAQDPVLWVVGQTSMPTLVVENIRSADSILWGARIGVDYDRLTTGGIKNTTVSNATRTSTTTVLTLTLGNPITVTRASRTGNVTTLTIPNPGLPFPNVRTGVPIVFTSGDSDFPSGAYTLTATNNFTAAPAEAVTWTVSYSDTGADVPEKAITGSSYKTHNCMAGDLIDFNSTSVHFLETQYYVDSVNSNGLAITVTDVWGDGNSNTNNPGTISRQERFFSGTVNVSLVNCGFNPSTLSPFCGHAFDIGNSLAWRPYMVGCSGNGAGTGPGDPRDERRQAAVYVYSGVGSVSNGGSALYFERGTVSNAPLFMEVAPNNRGYGQLQIYGLCGETTFASTGLPTVRVDGNSFTSVYTDNILGADSDNITPVVQLSGIPASAAHINRSGLITSSCVGGDNWWAPTIWSSTTGTGFPSPWVYNKTTTYADGRITGKHPGAARALGVTGARIKNAIPVSTSWTLNSATRTLGQLAPDGSSTATKITSAGNAVAIFPSGETGDTWEVGGRFVLCGWVNADVAAAYLPGAFLQISTSGVTFVDGQFRGAQYTGTGWQFISTIWQVATVSDSTPTIIVNVTIPNAKDMYFWGMTGFYVPVSITDNDAYEMAATMRHQPAYLPAGMSGTMEGGKLIAHGGIGTNTANTNTAGVGSGQLTLTGTGTVYLPMYDLDGTTILGWVALLQATVNP